MLTLACNSTVSLKQVSAATRALLPAELPLRPTGGVEVKVGASLPRGVIWAVQRRHLAVGVLEQGHQTLLPPC